MTMDAPADRPATAPLLSVVVKCYNEESRIGPCLASVLAATRGIDTEIIVADALSTDRTVENAQAFPVRIALMANAADRGCGATAQMGMQFARGAFLLLVDGDMELLPEFLPAALKALRDDPKLAGIGGRLIEMSESLEFQERKRRERVRPRQTAQRRLGGSALYRMTAIRDAGYFMNRNLYCGEELELGQRLRARGWHLQSLDIDAVRHHGHAAAPVTLLRERWKSRYFDGYGQLLRGAWRQPYFWETLRVCALFLAVAGWWLSLAALLGTTALGVTSAALPIAILLLPALAIAIRKRRAGLGAYTFLLWQFHAAAFLRGLFRPWRDPAEPVNAALIG